MFILFKNTIYTSVVYSLKLNDSQYEASLEAATRGVL